MWRGTVSVVSGGSSLTDGGLSHGESCIVKTKTIFMSNDPYDQCDVTMNGDHAKIPPLVSMQIPLCYADGRMPSRLRDVGRRRCCGL